MGGCLAAARWSWFSPSSAGQERAGWWCSQGCLHWFIAVYLPCASAWLLLPTLWTIILVAVCGGSMSPAYMQHLGWCVEMSCALLPCPFDPWSACCAGGARALPRPALPPAPRTHPRRVCRLRWRAGGGAEGRRGGSRGHDGGELLLLVSCKRVEVGQVGMEVRAGVYR